METSALEPLAVAVIGGGPVGLAAAAHFLARGVPVKVYEAGSEVGSNVRDWGHVRVFTPWRYCVDQAATKLLKHHGWRLPAADHYPTGAELLSTISNRSRQRLSWPPSLKPTPALPRSRGKASTKS
jgi:cation diffusion facilitator CzcD-associated flavoprotein CzcO